MKHQTVKNKNTSSGVFDINFNNKSGFNNFLRYVTPSLFFVIFSLFAAQPNTAQAQITSNVRTVQSTEQGTTQGAVNNANSYLTNKSIQLNATGSCDSTCDAMGPTAPASSIQATFVTRMVACSAGYTGNKTQTRTQNPDGSYSAWVDADTSLCVCSPTYSDSTQMCASPLAGTFVQRTNWTCSANVGSWGTPFTQTNNCFTPCALPSPSVQNTTGACPSGYSGTTYYQRDATCPGGVGANSSPSWGGWYNTSSNCVLNQPVYTAGHFAVNTYGAGSYFGVTNNTGANLTRTSGTYAGYWPAGTAFYTVRGTSSETFTISNGQTIVVYKSGSTFYAAVY